MNQQWGQPGYPYQQQQQSNFLQPQRTGFLQPQRTGFAQQQPPPVPPLPQGGFQSGYPPQNNNLSVGLAAQSQRFLSPSPGLQPQATGWNTAPLVSQPTGMYDPRIQMISNTFMPNVSAPYTPSGVPQFAGGGPLQGQSLQQSFQQHNQTLPQSSAPSVNWSLSKEERKSYDAVFRAWDTQNTGFISGEIALEVFGQSGLDRNDLAQIWTLADADDRGKLNIQEFHVAMGLIYRRLNGTPLPSVLPPELVPVSSKNLGESVDFLKDLLKNDTSVRATNSGASREKVRSFLDPVAQKSDSRRDATIYTHNDKGVRGYISSSRRVDRDAIRVGDASPSDDLSDIKRQLANTNKRLDKDREDAEARTAEDEALDTELDDLKYRVRRVQDDIEHVNRGPRTNARDQERRKLERELLYLMHEKVPEVEKKIQDRERRKKREREQWSRDRDSRNGTSRNERHRASSPSSGRYRHERDHDSDRDHNDDDDEDQEGYLRGTFDRDRDSNRDRDYDRRSQSRNDMYQRDGRNRDRDYERTHSPSTVVRSPAPPTPAATPEAPRPPARAPAASPAPQLKAMTPAERTVFIRAEAQRRLEERKRALGVAAPSSPVTVDTSVEDRLAMERKEAEEKARQAENDVEERAKQRQQRLDGEKAARKAPPKPTPPPVAKRTPAPAPAPPSRHSSASRPAVITAPAPAPPPVKSAVPQINDDEEEEELRRREEVLKKRAARRAELEREEEAARLEEEQFLARRQVSRANTQPPVTLPVTRARPPPPPTRKTAISPTVNPVGSASPPPPPPPPPPAPVIIAPPPNATPPPTTNPFHKLTQQISGSSAPSPSIPSNPWSSVPVDAGAVRAQAVPPPPPPPAPPVSTISKTTPPIVKSQPVHLPQDDDDWDDLVEKDDSGDSSEDDFDGRNTRSKLAEQIFRPKSAAANPPSRTTTPAPAGSAAMPLPPPPPPVTIKIPSGPVDRGALLGSIQSGAKLRKTVTNDRSTAAVAGAVLGDAAPPAHIADATITRLASPSPPPIIIETPSSSQTALQKSDNRQSVDWYAGLASEGLTRTFTASTAHDLPSHQEEEESEDDPPLRSVIPAIEVQHAPEQDMLPTNDDPMADIDTNTDRKVRTLYSYEGQRQEDLSFGENLIINAHPSKSGGDWWHGTLIKGGKTGFFPSSYVASIDQAVSARALFSYVGGDADELPFAEGDVLTIIDHSEADWWKTEKDGVVFIVPAAYLTFVESSG